MQYSRVRSDGSIHSIGCSENPECWIEEQIHGSEIKKPHFFAPVLQSSPEYAFVCIDRWFKDKIRNNIAGAHERVRGVISELLNNSVLRTIGEKHFENEEEMQKAIGQLVMTIITMQRSFSHIYDMFTVFSQSLENVDPKKAGVAEEYFQPIAQSIAPFEKFVTLIRKRADSIFPDEIPVADIDQDFADTIGSGESYMRIFCKLCDTAGPLSNFLQGEIASAFIKVLTILKLFNDTIAPVFNHILRLRAFDQVDGGSHI
jgi:hypothetical protein